MLRALPWRRPPAPVKPAIAGLTRFPSARVLRPTPYTVRLPATHIRRTIAAAVQARGCSAAKRQPGRWYSGGASKRGVSETRRRRFAPANRRDEFRERAAEGRGREVDMPAPIRPRLLRRFAPRNDMYGCGPEPMQTLSRTWREPPYQVGNVPNLLQPQPIRRSQRSVSARDPSRQSC
jgi:hypothetical protein